MTTAVVAEFLLRNEYLLTALEFYQELVESGKPHPPFLKQFFEHCELRIEDGSEQSSSDGHHDSDGGRDHYMPSGENFMDELNQSQSQSVQLRLPQRHQTPGSSSTPSTSGTTFSFSSPLSSSFGLAGAQILQPKLEDELRTKEETISILNYENSILKQDLQKLKDQMKTMLLSGSGVGMQNTTMSAGGVNDDQMIRGRSNSQPLNMRANGFEIPTLGDSVFADNDQSSVKSQSSSSSSSLLGTPTSSDDRSGGFFKQKRRGSMRDNEDEQKLLRLLSSQDSIQPQEKQILNSLIYDYLTEMDYKISSISFSDEVDTLHLDNISEKNDDSVSLSLLYLFRYYFHASNRTAQTLKDTEALQKALSKLDEKRKQIAEYENDLRAQDRMINSLETENRTLKNRVASFQTEKIVSTPASHDAEVIKGAPGISSGEEGEMTDLSSERQQKLESKEATSSISRDETANGLRREITILETKLKKYENDDTNFITLMGQKLPSMVHAVKSSAREEFLPILIELIQLHENPAGKDRLAHALFQLFKRPDEHERQLIIDGCIHLSREISPEQFENVLLPHAWEDITHRYPERRQLVAEACGLLAEYVRPALRNSLLLSMLQQLMDDGTDVVRLSVVTNLHRLILVVEDEFEEKYTVLQEMVLKLLIDSNGTVAHAAMEQLLPLLLQCARSWDMLFSRFTPTIFEKLDASVFTLSQHRDHQSSERVIALISIIQASFPFIHQTILVSMPTRTLMGLTQDFQEEDGDNVVRIKLAFDRWIIREFGSCTDSTIMDAIMRRQNHHENQEWSSCEWIIRLIPHLLSVSISIDTSHVSVRHKLQALVSSICELFGKTFTETFVRKMFLAAIDLHYEVPPVKNMNILSKEKNIIVKSRLLTIFLLGVLTNTDDHHFGKYLTDVVINVAMEQNGWTHDHISLLEDAVSDTCKQNQQDEIMSIVWELVLNPSAQVRGIVVRLFSVIMDAISSAAIAVRIFPAMITLSTDPDDSIRMQVVKTMGKLVMDIDETKEFDKVEQQFEAFFSDSNEDIRFECLKQLNFIIPSVDPYFRDKYILRKLFQIGRDNLNNANSNNTGTRQRVAMMLFEGYNALGGCTLDKSVLSQFVIPGLTNLERDSRVAISDPSVRASIKRMLREYKRMDKSLASSSSGSNKMDK